MCDIFVCVCVCVKDWASWVGKPCRPLSVAFPPYAMCVRLFPLSAPARSRLLHRQLALSVCASHTRLELIFMLWLYFRKGWRWAWIEAGCLPCSARFLSGAGVVAATVCGWRGVPHQCCRGRYSVCFCPKSSSNNEVSPTRLKKYKLNCAFMLF